MFRPVGGFCPPPPDAPTTRADAAGKIRQGRGIGYPGAELATPKAAPKTLKTANARAGEHADWGLLCPPSAGGPLERTLAWDGAAVVAVDQCALPHERTVLRLTTPDEVIDAIKRLAIRGAPAIGVAGALAVALSAQLSDGDEQAVREDAERIANARPTAVNLSWAVRRVLTKLPGGARGRAGRGVRDAGGGRADQSAPWPPAPPMPCSGCGRPAAADPDPLQHRGLAAVAVGTALGAIRNWPSAARSSRWSPARHGRCCRAPRLTAWELAQAGIPFRLYGRLRRAGGDRGRPGRLVMVGADRIAANGDTANKIGTYSLAVAAHRSGIPSSWWHRSPLWTSLADGAGSSSSSGTPTRSSTFPGTRTALAEGRRCSTRPSM